jgi:hypothetical protein
MNRPQVLVDPEREAHPLDAVRRRGVRTRPRAEHDAVARRLRDAHEDRLAAVVQQSFEHASATAQQSVHPPAAQAKRTRRTDLNALFNARHARVV